MAFQRKPNSSQHHLGPHDQRPERPYRLASYPRLALTAWCAISARACWPGGLADWWLPFGGAAGDKAGDGHVGLIEVFAPSEVPLEGPPLLVLGVGVLDADPF